jgi:DNA-binding IclR family transcriptional regulator
MKTDDVSPGPLGRYMEVLELVAAFPGALTLADVASILDLPKTTAHRLLKGLVKAGLAKEGGGGRSYDLGERLTRLVHATVEDGWLVTLADTHLRQVTETTGETCYLTRLVGAHVVVAVSVSPDVRWRGYVQPGVEMPINAAASAKAIMAYQNDALISQVLSEPLPLLTANTRNDRAWVEEELQAVRDRGYATCIGEIDEGLAAISVPITLPDGIVLHALGMTGPLQRVMNERLPDRIAALNATAATLAKALALGTKIRARAAS